MLTDDVGRAIAARNGARWEICLERLIGRAPAGDSDYLLATADELLD